MNIKFHPRRDDFIDRLFSFLSLKLPMAIDQIIRIREHVFLVKTKHLTFILKGFSSLSKLNIQQDLTDSLEKEGFAETYTFYQFTDEPLFLENLYYGCINYISTHPTPFTYRSQAERKEGLDLLSNFHSTTEKLVPHYHAILPKQDLLTRWEERFERFKRNLPIVNYYIPKEVAAEILDWGKQGLAGMSQFQSRLETGKPVILHGDVAHHNFIRSQAGKLHLIDFDLISVGPKSFDLLQYANRVLPSLNWSMESLIGLNQLAPLLTNQGFSYGLMYPSDIFREWNRMIKYNTFRHPTSLATLIELTVKQFYKRKRFVNRLQIP